MKDIELIPNAPILIESTRSIGYSFETALADIIDNSLAKRAKRVDVFFESQGDPYVAVVDDGEGMLPEELFNAMRYGSKSSLDERDITDLGRFGLGMKTASLSQCRKLTVFTKKENHLVGAKWDLDYVLKKNSWMLQTIDENESKENKFASLLSNKSSGTVVVWEDFDRIKNSTTYFSKTFDKKVEIAREHISLVFHRFMSEELAQNRIHIFFNNDELSPIDPFLLNNPATQPLSEQTLIIEGKQIKVKPFILPYTSKLNAKDKKMLGDLSDLRRTQGFYVYRNKRLIIWGTWFKLIKSFELNKLARVRVDIPNSLDSIWDIDIKKSSASLPDSIKKNLVNIVLNTVGKSENVYKYRGRKVNSDEMIHIWNVINNREKYTYRINKNLPIYKSIIDKLDEEGEQYLNSFIEMIENSFPVEDIYYRMGKNEINIDDNEDFEKVYSAGLDMLNSAKQQGFNIKEFLKSLEHIEYFAKHKDVIEKLKEDFEYE